jgi:CrcB protein
VTALLVALGAGLGAAIRFITAHHLDGRTPWGTLAVNVVASFALGALVGTAPADSVAALLGIGLCGGMSTYSAFAVQTQERGWVHGSAYAGATILLAVGGCALGFLVAS